jgi:hypothetical protein
LQQAARPEGPVPRRRESIAPAPACGQRVPLLFSAGARGS